MAGVGMSAGNGRLVGKRALVVGGAGSVGSGIVVKLLAEGAQVVAADRNLSSLESFAQEHTGAALSTVVIDIADAASTSSGVQDAISTLGGLDIVVNATGISHQGTEIDDETLEGWNQVLSVNLTGSFILVKQTLAHLGAGGAYVFISSTGAERGLPLNLAYGASKAGLANFTKGLATALGPRGIRVNTVGPGLMAFPVRNDADNSDRRVGRTDVVPLGRLGEGADIGNVVAFLVSEEAGWVTGQNIYVDGGSLAR